MSGDEAAAVRAAAERLEEVAARLREGDAPPEELRALAEEALSLGTEITERVPRTLRPAGEGEG